MKPIYLVAGTKSWNREIFEEKISKLPGTWHYLGDPNELSPTKIGQIDPQYIFFLHWSWKVPSEIYENYECICFHLGDVPYGRGGSPLQNLIVRGHRQTKLTALRMVAEMDAGPVYLKESIRLDGNAQEILVRTTELSAEMIRTILATNPKPIPQEGEPFIFKRRTPKQSEIPSLLSMEALYDFIRMLDGEGYPPAFISSSGFRFEFKNACIENGTVSATVRIAPAQP